MVLNLNRGCYWLVAACGMLPGLVCAQAPSTSSVPAFPSKQLRIVVAFPPGGPIDLVARMMLAKFGEAMGQSVIVDNRGGAGGTIGVDHTAKSAPDGYSMVLSSTSLAIYPHVYPKLPFDAFRDLAPVSMGSINPQMLFAHPSVQANNVPELIALAKQKPGQLNCASAGTGTPNHLGCELLKSMAGINFVHVPYKGATPGFTDVVAGQMHFMFNSIPAVLPMVKTGKLKALGVGGPKRSPAAPTVPAIAETLPGFECVNWYAMLAPAGTPAAIISKINGEMVKMIADPPFAQRLLDMGSEPLSSTPAGLADHMRKESDRWARVIKSAGIKIER